MKTSVNIDNIFEGLPQNVVYCIHDVDTKNYLLGPDKISFCSDDCFKEHNLKIDINDEKCLESCFNSSHNKYEYNNICYNKCPNGTLNYNNLCLDLNCAILSQYSIECSGDEPSGYYYDINEEIYKKCHDNCKTCLGEGDELNNNCSECKHN